MIQINYILINMKTIVITSGFFNPIHVGHINLFREAKNLGDILIVILNTDEQVKLKGSAAFMPENERLEIIKAIKYIDEVFLSVDKDISVVESIKAVVKRFSKDKLIFAKGGDRNSGNIPEADICRELGIKIVNGVGGNKVQSSSWLLKKANG